MLFILTSFVHAFKIVFFPFSLSWPFVYAPFLLDGLVDSLPLVGSGKMVFAVTPRRTFFLSFPLSPFPDDPHLAPPPACLATRLL